MRAMAVAKHLRAPVTIIAGEAEAIPPRDGSCRAAWLSTVIHHIADLSECAQELERVLQPGGPVLIRGSFANRQDEIPLFRFFPGALQIASTFPTVEATVTAFETAGFAGRQCGDCTSAKTRVWRVGETASLDTTSRFHSRPFARRGIRGGGLRDGQSGGEQRRGRAHWARPSRSPIELQGRRRRGSRRHRSIGATGTSRRGDCSRR